MTSKLKSWMDFRNPDFWKYRKSNVLRQMTVVFCRRRTQNELFPVPYDFFCRGWFFLI